MVTIFLFATAEIGVMQERVACPSTWTVQAPQSAIPQPNLVPVRPISSRSVHNRGVSPGTSRLCRLPLMSSWIIAALLLSSSRHGEPRRESPNWRCLLLDATSVRPLKLGDLLVIERDRSAPVPLFAHEVESGRRLMATEARPALREVDDVVSPISDPGAGLGDVQSEELPAVRPGKFVTRMLHHCFERDQLQDRPNRVLPVRFAVAEDAHGLVQLFRISVLDACISDLWPVEDAAKGLRGNGNIVRGRAVHHTEAKSRRQEAPLDRTSREVAHVLKNASRSALT